MTGRDGRHVSRGGWIQRGLLLALTSAVWLGAGLPARAGGAAETSEAAEEDPNATVHAGTERVEVTGEGRIATGAPTSFVSVIRPADRRGAITSLADLLGAAPGVRVRSYGGLNGFATVSIRGSSPDQVMVLVDGVPLNSPLGGGFNLAEVPLAGVEAIEVHRGFTPAGIGTASIGGAVNIRTRRPGDGSGVNGSLAYGSFGTAEAAAMGRLSTGPMAWVLSGQAFTTRGDFDYLDNNATPFNEADDTFTTRANNESWSLGTRAAGTVAVGRGRTFTLTADYMARRQGVPGIDAFQSESATLDKSRALVTAAMRWEGLAGGGLDLDAALDGAFTSQDYRDTDDPLAVAPQDTSTRIQGGGARVSLAASPWEGHRLSLLLQPRLDTVRVESHLASASDPIDARRATLAAVAEDEIRLASGRILLAPSVRFDTVATGGRGGAPGAVTEPADDPSNWSGRLGALWIVSARWSLRGNVGRYFRIPSLLELYGNEGTLVGNPSLEPESGLNADLGFTWAPGRMGAVSGLAAELSAFSTASDDLILLRSLATRQVKAFNVGAARITGVEASLSLRLLERLDLSGNITFQHPEDRSDSFNRGYDLPGVPRREAATSEALDLGMVGLFHRFTYIGENSISNLGQAAANLPSGRRELTVIPSRYLHDAGATLRLGSRGRLTAEVLNLFDRHVVDVARYPLPGRTLLLKVEGSW